MKKPYENATSVTQALAGGACMTIDELDNALALTRRQISTTVGTLILRGCAERLERGCYRLTPAGKAAVKRDAIMTGGPNRAAAKPRNNTLRQRAWTVMRMCPTFSIGDLLIAACGPKDKKPEENLTRYLRALKGGSYVAELPTRTAATATRPLGSRRFRLLKNTGEFAPTWDNLSKVLYDKNLRVVVPCSPR